jgi:hypothetical protein
MKGFVADTEHTERQLRLQPGAGTGKNLRLVLMCDALCGCAPSLSCARSPALASRPASRKTANSRDALSHHLVTTRGLYASLLAFDCDRMAASTEILVRGSTWGPAS